MNEPNETPRRYKWPWVVAAFVILGILLSMIWLAVAVQKVERERGWSESFHTNTPAH